MSVLALLLATLSVGPVHPASVWSNVAQSVSSLFNGQSAEPIALVDNLNVTCGKTRLKGGTIVGGVVAGEGEFPWIVSFQYVKKDKTRKHFCGGVIINENWVLSAGHCFHKQVLRVVLG